MAEPEKATTIAGEPAAEELHETPFTEGGPGAAAPSAAPGAAPTEEVNLSVSDLFLGCVASSLFGPRPAKDGPTVTREQAGQAFCGDARKWLDRLGFDQALDLWLAQSGIHSTSVKPVYLVGAGAVAVALLGWTYWRLVRPPKEESGELDHTASD